MSDTKPSFHLHYFNMRGRGETARLLFALKGQDYIDTRVDPPDWPALRPGKSTKFIIHLNTVYSLCTYHLTTVLIIRSYNVTVSL